MAISSADRNKRHNYELACLIAAKLIEDPSLVEHGRRHLERHIKCSPFQRRYYEMWSKLLTLEPREIASRLVAQSPEGDLLRDTRPVFYVIEAAERAAILNKSRQALT